MMNRFIPDLFDNTTEQNTYQTRSHSIPQPGRTNSLREAETELSQGYGCSQTFQSGLGQGRDSEVEIGGNTHQINPAHLLEVFGYRFSTIAANTVENRKYTSKDRSQELQEDIQSLFYDFQKTQLLLLDQFRRQSEVIKFCYEQFTISRNQLFRVSAERDRLANEVKSIQKLLDETRDVLSISNQKYRNLDNKWKAQVESLQNQVKVKESYIGDEDQHENPGYTMISTPHLSNAPNISHLTSINKSYHNDAVVATPYKNENNDLPIGKSMSSNAKLAVKLQASKQQYTSLNDGSTNFKTKLFDMASITDSEKKLMQKFHEPDRKGTPPRLREANSREPHAFFGIDLDKITCTDPYLSMSSYDLNSKENPASEFKILFDNLLNLIERWCKNHTRQFSKRNDVNVAIQNSTLWSFMINCADASDGETSESRAKEFISQPSTRYRFIMRIVVTYIFKDILSLKNFYGFIDAATEKLLEFESRMEKRALTTVARQSLINQRDAAVRIIIDHDDSIQWRSMRLKQHTRRLQDMLRSLLREDCEINFADRDLHEIVITALDLCARVHSSALTFQIIFPDIRSKFNTRTMIVCDKDLVKSQASHLTSNRLKLIVTPIVTMRDDRGRTIKAKSIQLAKVLTMA